MAKSIRSKWKRKMRAVKRERYGKKELDRLKKTLGINESEDKTTDVNMEHMSEVVTIVTVDDINKKKAEVVEKDVMDLSEVDDIKKFNAKTLRNENGAYPVWVHPRKIKRANKEKKKTKAKGKVTKGRKRGKSNAKSN